MKGVVIIKIQFMKNRKMANRKQQQKLWQAPDLRHMAARVQ